MEALVLSEDGGGIACVKSPATWYATWSATETATWYGGGHLVPTEPQTDSIL